MNAERESALELEHFYRPRSIVVVGAHDGREPLKNLTMRLTEKAADVSADIYYVNPMREEVFGQKTFSSITDVPGEIDVLAVLIGDAAQTINAAAAKKPRFTLVFAGGFGELGTPEGDLKQVELMDAVRNAGTRLNGPNTTVNSLEVLAKNRGPAIAIATQSGMQGRPLAQLQELGVHISYWATTGNEADLESADFIEYFARDKKTTAIAGYIEGFADGEQLRAASLAALQEETPISLIKIGRSATGASMAQSHTGHLVGSDSAHDAFFEQFGITRVDDMDALLEVSLVYSRSMIPEEGGVALFCNSGGSAAHLSDLLSAYGLPIPVLTSETQRELSNYIPDSYLISNPVDNGGPAMLLGNGPKMIEAVVNDPGIAVLLVPITGDWERLTIPTVEAILHARSISDKPIIPIWQGPTFSQHYRKLLDAGLPVVRNFRNAIVAVDGLFRRRHLRQDGAEFRAAALALPPLNRLVSSSSQTLDEADSISWLAERGIPFVPYRLAKSIEDAATVAEEMGYPVVLKGLVSGIHHKSELGLVRVGLNTKREVIEAATEMTTAVNPKTVETFLISELAPQGVELLLGLTRDPVVGPVIVLGAGGTEAELHEDIATSVLPLTRSRAEEMIDSLRISKALAGWRGAPAANREAVVDVLLRFADIATEEAETILEIDVNPLLATPEGVVGLDGLVRIASIDKVGETDG